MNQTIADESISRFSSTVLNTIFKISAKYNDRLASRESKWLEFKKSFNWGSRSTYARTSAAFANTKGGYMVFGVDNKPHKLIGLQSDNFENIDPSTISSFLNEYFAPELIWYSYIHEFRGQKYGIIYISESEEKPAVCLKTMSDGKELKEGEVYYRYGGRTSVIRYPELRAILDQWRQKERSIWLEYLSRIAKIGVREASILDLKSGELTGIGGTYFIDKSILPNLNFIKAGEFREKNNKPVIKIIGEAETVQPGMISPIQTVYKSKVVTVHAPDIIRSFLNQEKVSEPKEYLKAICFETSALLPIYYYIYLANLTRVRSGDLINQIKSTSQTKMKLIQRLNSDRDFACPMPLNATKVGKEKLSYLNRIMHQNMVLDNNISYKQLRHLLDAIRALKADKINSEYLYKLLLQIFDRYYGDRTANISGDIRMATCFLDSILYSNRINK